MSTASQGTNGARSSLDIDRLSSPSPTKGLNGDAHDHPNGGAHGEDLEDMEPLDRLQLQLERTRQEKEALASQYNNLLAKLTTMRTTLGNKLKQDAVRDTLQCLVRQCYDLSFA